MVLNARAASPDGYSECGYTKTTSDTCTSFHDGRLLTSFLPLVSPKTFLAHRGILLVLFEALLCRIINGITVFGNCNCFNDFLGYYCQYDVINDARFWREL